MPEWWQHLTSSEKTAWIAATSACVAACAALLSATATSVGVIAAALVARRWRAEARAKKRAEVAGEVLIAGFRFLEALEYATTPFVIGAPAQAKGISPVEQRAQLFAERWTTGREAFDKFENATRLAQTYLPTETEAPIDALWRAKRKTWASQKTIFGMLAQEASDHPSFSKIEADAFLDEGQIKALRDGLSGILRPLAQHED